MDTRGGGSEIWKSLNPNEFSLNDLNLISEAGFCVGPLSLSLSIVD